MEKVNKYGKKLEALIKDLKDDQEKALTVTGATAPEKAKFINAVGVIIDELKAVDTNCFDYHQEKKFLL